MAKNQEILGFSQLIKNKTKALVLTLVEITAMFVFPTI
jgi:hypothetical protein